MQAGAVAEFLNGLGAALMSGDIRAVAARFTTPAPVYLGDDLMVLGTRAMAENAMRIMRDGLRAHGVTTMAARVVATELPRGPMQKIWVDWDYFGAGGAAVATVRTEYVLREAQDAALTRIEMVNYVNFAFPAIVSALPLVR